MDSSNFLYVYHAELHEFHIKLNVLPKIGILTAFNMLETISSTKNRKVSWLMIKETNPNENDGSLFLASFTCFYRIHTPSTGRLSISIYTTVVSVGSSTRLFAGISAYACERKS